MLKIFSNMLLQLGAPYVWQAKGDALWTPAGPQPFGGQKCFDCSGLFGYGAKLAGLKDRRMTHSAQTWMDELEKFLPSIPFDVAVQASPVVCFFGHPGGTTSGVDLLTGGAVTKISPPHATHIALAISMYGVPWMVEAAGGDETTTSIAAANARGAKVRFGPILRNDMIAFAKQPTT